jgi:hypothetical protein
VVYADAVRGRPAALRELRLLDTSPSEAFDRITRMASRLFDLPISAISLTDKDRQWFKSRVGVDVPQLPRYKAPCAQVTSTRDVVVLPDILKDFAYLQNIPADVIKIDRSFMGGLERERDQKLVRAMITMSHELNYRVVAEGVETQEAYEFLAKSG